MGFVGRDVARHLPPRRLALIVGPESELVVGGRVELEVSEKLKKACTLLVALAFAVGDVLRLEHSSVPGAKLGSASELTIRRMSNCEMQWILRHARLQSSVLRFLTPSLLIFSRSCKRVSTVHGTLGAQRPVLRFLTAIKCDTMDPSF